MDVLLEWETITSFAAFGSEGKSHDHKEVDKITAANWAIMKPDTSEGRMPENVLVRDRAIVTAGFANDVEAVNQYAPVMYAPTANGTASDPTLLQPQITESSPNVAMNSLNI